MGYEVYQDDASEYRWRLVDGNGATIADSSEGYDSKDNAKRAVANVQGEAPSDIVIDIDEEEETDVNKETEPKELTDSTIDNDPVLEFDGLESRVDTLEDRLNDTITRLDEMVSYLTFVEAALVT